MGSDERRSLRVHVVDEDGAARRELRSALEAAGLEVTYVGRPGDYPDDVPPDAADALVADDPDGILELLERVRERDAFLPIVVYTADESMAGEAIASGADEFVPKSDGPEAVLDRLAAVVASPPATGAGEGEERYRRLIETSPAPINLFDAEGTTIWGNDAVLDLLGLGSREELVGRSIFDFIHPEDRELAQAELETVVRDGVATGPTSMGLTRADGTVRDILVSTAPGRFRGKPIGQAVVIDVSSIVEARSALEAERRVVDNALDTLSDVFFVVDPAWRLRRWNAAALETTGYTDPEFAELTVTDLIADEDLPRVVEAIDAALAEGSATVEARVVTADEERIPHEFRGSRLEDDEGNPAGVVGIARDLSDLRERERQLLVFEQMLRHNVRHNVNLIVGYADSMRDGSVDVEAGVEDIRRHAARMVEQADKQKRLVGLIREPGDRTPMDLDDALAAVVSSARERHPGADIEFRPSGEHPVRAVPGLAVAVEELVENAIEHTDRETPEVTVELAVTDEGCRVRVTDRGPGVPALERSVIADDEPIDQLHHGSGVVCGWSTGPSASRAARCTSRTTTLVGPS